MTPYLGQVKVHELVVALKSTSANSDLKKQLNRVQKRQKTLTTPLSKPEQERVSYGQFIFANTYFI